MIILNKCDNLDSAHNISSQLKINENLAELLVTRGIDTVQKAADFLSPKLANLSDINNYVGLEAVAERVQLAIDEKQTVAIYGDYDCDGICGASILYLFLKAKEVEVFAYLPTRADDGYGLNVELLEKITETCLPDLLITVDCGITNIEEVEYCNEALGFDVIVTDHHNCGQQLPDCLIFNPQLSDSSQVFTKLCGAGVALRLVEKLAGLEESKKYYDIAALATVADVVPLVGDNRIITYFGLKSINSGYRKGIDLLVKSNEKQRGEVTATDIAFKLAPKINSIGRLDNANKVLALFCENDRFLLDCLIGEISKTNEKRQQMTVDLYDYCKEKLTTYDFENCPIIMMYNAYWEEGVLGIAAAKIASDFNRPTILFTKAKDGSLKGSGRSVAGVDLHALLLQCSSIMTKFGGHAMACGLSLEEVNFEKLFASVNHIAKLTIDESVFELNYSYDILLNDIKSPEDFCHELAFFEPFGEGNAEPTFAYYCTSGKFEQIGMTEHVKQKANGIEYVGWGMGKQIKALNNDTDKTILCNLTLSSFSNTLTPQARIVDFFVNSLPQGDDFEEVASQAIFAGDSVFSPKEISERDALNIASESKYGVCFIAYDKDTFNNFKRLLDNQKFAVSNESDIKEENLQIATGGNLQVAENNDGQKVAENNDDRKVTESNDGRNVESASETIGIEKRTTKVNVKVAIFKFENITPYNTLIFSPSGKENFAFFKKIVFLDKPLNLGFVDELVLSPRASVYYIDNRVILEKCKKYLPSYENLGKVFVALRELLQKKLFKSAYMLFWDLSKTYEIEYNSFVIALNIFVELKIFVWQADGLFYDKSVVSKISTSKLYNCLKEG